MKKPNAATHINMAIFLFQNKLGHGVIYNLDAFEPKTPTTYEAPLTIEGIFGHNPLNYI